MAFPVAIGPARIRAVLGPRIYAQPQRKRPDKSSMPVSSNRSPRLLPRDVFPSTLHRLKREFGPGATGRFPDIKAADPAQLSPLRPGLPDAAAPDALPEAGDSPSWGQRVRSYRAAQGLSRDQLAQLAGISTATVRNIETGRHHPSRRIELNLDAVFEHGCLPAIEHGARPVPSEKPGPRLQSWIAPSFDVIELIRAWMRFLGGSGGRIDPSQLFFDSASAASWCLLAERTPLSQQRAALPLPQVASIVAQLGSPALSIYGLGCGDASSEVYLTEQLRSQGAQRLTLYLLDTSPVMLAKGYQRAMQALGDQAEVTLCGVLGDLRNLPSYTPLFKGTSRRLVCLFGAVFPSLENEVRFLRGGLSVLRAGDLLLLDVALATREELPADALGPLPAGARRDHLVADWLLGPFRRQSSDFRGATVVQVKDRSVCAVPGSYAVEMRIQVEHKRRPASYFSVEYERRYELDPLTACLRKEGWSVLERWAYCEGRSLLLCEKQSS